MNTTPSIHRSPARTALAAVLGLTAAILGLALLAGCGDDQDADDADGVAVVTDEVDVIPVAPDTALVIETETVDLYEPHTRHVEAVRAHHAAGRTDSSATHLEALAVDLNRRAAQAEGETKTALEDAAQEGDRLARSVREDAAVTNEALHGFLARADAALAAFHLRRADQALEYEHTDVAARHLDVAARAYAAAASALDEAGTSAGAASGADSVADRMRQTATSLEGPDFDIETARAAIAEYQRDVNVLHDEARGAGMEATPEAAS